MDIIFLGTSAGIPTIQRNVSAIAIRHFQESTWDLFDCGEGTQHQILKTSLSLFKLKRIFITHLHGDHIYGLPGLLASRSLLKAETPLEIYGPIGIKKILLILFKYSSLNLNYQIDIHEFSTTETQIEFKNFTLNITPLSHSVDSFAYILQKSPYLGKFKLDLAKSYKIPPGEIYQRLKNKEIVVLEDGRQFDGKDFVEDDLPGTKIIIGGDNDTPHLLQPKISSCDLLIHEATFTESIFQKLPNPVKHSTAKQVALFAEENNIKNLILTHFSPRFLQKTKSNLISLLKEEAHKYFSGNLYLAKDLQHYQLNKFGKITLLKK